MTETIDLIDALAKGKTSTANNVFNDLMGSKISAALDARKIELANQVYNGVEQEITNADVQSAETESSTE